MKFIDDEAAGTCCTRHIHKTDFFVALLRAAKTSNSYGQIGTAPRESTSCEAFGNSLVHGLAALNILSSDSEQFALCIRRICNETSVEMGTKPNIASKERGKLTAGATLCGDDLKTGMLERGHKLVAGLI